MPFLLPCLCPCTCSCLAFTLCSSALRFLFLCSQLYWPCPRAWPPAGPSPCDVFVKLLSLPLLLLRLLPSLPPFSPLLHRLTHVLPSCSSFLLPPPVVTFGMWVLGPVWCFIFLLLLPGYEKRCDSEDSNHSYAHTTADLVSRPSQSKVVGCWRFAEMGTGMFTTG